MITIKFLGEYREAAGTGETKLNAEEFKTIGDILSALPGMYEGIDISRAKTAKNNSFVETSEPVADNDIVVVMPPVTGG